MKARMIFKRRFSVQCKSGRVLSVFMDLFLIEDTIAAFPYRFSWIAVDPDETASKVLFDCHPPKGPHFHLGDDPVGTAFKWKSVNAAQDLFWKAVANHFGELESEEE